MSGQAVKKEEAMEMDEDMNVVDESTELLDPSEPLPDVVTSINSQSERSQQIGQSTSSGTTDATTTGFDDTLKDSAPGRYGKIVVYKSGKAYLVVGDKNNSKAPPVKMRLENGLPCAFLQQAVSIDTNNGYVPLGELKKSIVVTPDVEKAFPSAT